MLYRFNRGRGSHWWQESGSGKSVLTKTFTGMLEENGRIASGSIIYRGKLTDIKKHEEWEKIRGAKNCNYFPGSNDKS